MPEMSDPFQIYRAPMSGFGPKPMQGGHGQHPLMQFMRQFMQSSGQGFMPQQATQGSGSEYDSVLRMQGQPPQPQQQYLRGMLPAAPMAGFNSSSNGGMGGFPFGGGFGGGGFGGPMGQPRRPQAPGSLVGPQSRWG